MGKTPEGGLMGRELYRPSSCHTTVPPACPRRGWVTLLGWVLFRFVHHPSLLLDSAQENSSKGLS